MQNFKAIIEYDGTDFAGYQWQHETRTIQGVVEDAIRLRTGQNIRVAGAGRTDAGVHALGQVVSFRAETRIPLDRMAYALNSALPPDLTVRSVEEADEAFHARFSASSRIYLYLILNRRMPSALWRRYSAFLRHPLEADAMRNAAQRMVGEHDFAGFANELKPGEPTTRDVMRCEVARRGDFMLIRMEANAFLRGMVRNTVGTLIEIGAGKRPPEDINAILASRDRRTAGPSAPAQGLCLLRARYGTRRHNPRR